MARIKPRQKDLTKIPDKHDDKPKGTIQNVGGHIIDPPEDCPYRKKIGDAIWADAGCCQCCCESKCKRFLKVKRMRPYERAQDLRDHGVYYPWKN